MFLKRGLVLIILSLVLTIPTISFAENDIDILSNEIFESNILPDKKGNFEKQEIPEEVKVKIKELKEKLKNGEITKEQFHKEMKQLFPGKTHFKKRGSFKDLPEETKTKLKELKEKLINGEITEEQFQEEIEKIMPKQELPKRINPKKFKKESLDNKVE